MRGTLWWWRYLWWAGHTVVCFFSGICQIIAERRATGPLVVTHTDTETQRKCNIIKRIKVKSDSSVFVDNNYRFLQTIKLLLQLLKPSCFLVQVNKSRILCVFQNVWESHYRLGFGGIRKVKPLCSTDYKTFRVTVLLKPKYGTFFAPDCCHVDVRVRKLHNWSHTRCTDCKIIPPGEINWIHWLWYFRGQCVCVCVFV